MDPLYLSLCLVVDGEEIPSDHVMRSAGPNAITLISAASKLGPVELQSTYVGSPESPNVAVTDLVRLEQDPVEVESRELICEGAILPYAPERCLYDHLQRLQDLLLLKPGRHVVIEGIDSAVIELQLGETLP